MKIDRIKLLKTLGAVSPGIADKELVQQSTTFLFQNDRICTYNGQASVSASFKSGLTASVKAAPLLKLLGKLPDPEIDVELVEGEFRITSVASKAAVASEAEIHLDLLDLVGKPAVWIHLPEGFCEATQLCLYSVSSDDNRPDLSSLHMTAERLESVDNVRASRFVFASPWEDLKKLRRPDLLIPGWAVSDLMKYDPTEVGVTEGWLHFRDKEGTEYCCRQMATEYPNIDYVFNVEGTKVKFPDGLAGALDRAGVMAEAEFAHDERVKISVKDTWMLVVGRGENGWVKERLEVARAPATPYSFSINPGFLGTILKRLQLAIVGKEKIKLVQRDGAFEHVISLFSADAEE